MNRDELIEAYAQYIVDGMDMKDIWQLAYEMICQRLHDYCQPDLEDEVRELAPHLLGDDNE